MVTYKFRIEVNNLQTVQVRITKSGDSGFQEVNPEGKLRFLENKERIETFVHKARYLPNTVEAIKREEIEELGSVLFETLFEGEVRASFWDYYKKVRDLNWERENSATLSVELRFDEEVDGIPLLASLPWEFLYAKDVQQDDPWLVHSPAIRFSRLRQLKCPLTSKRLYPGKPLRIALAVTEFEPKILEKYKLGQIHADPVRLRLNNLAENSFGTIEFFDFNKQLELNEAMDLSTLARLLEKYQPHIFHFIGHGQFNDNGQTPYGEIALVNFGQPDWKIETDFCKIFDKHQPSVVVLQSCQGGAKSALNPNAGVGPQILGKQIPLVVAMQYEISNIAANIFAEEFYNCLANDISVKEAVQEARRKMLMNMSSFDTRDLATPMLFVNRCDRENPFYRETELERLWQILTASSMPSEGVIQLLDNLATDLGRMSNISLPVGKDLADWLECLYLLQEQRWNISSNKWDYSFTQDDYMHPFQWLVEHLATLAPKDSSKMLQDWNDQIKIFKTTPEALNNLRTSLCMPANERVESECVLLITISQPELDEENYLINVDYYCEGVWRPQGNTLANRSTLDSELVHVFDNLAALQLSRKKTSIGFLVPAELMTFEFEKVKNGVRGHQLGWIFPVVVRAFGRDQAPYLDYMNLWQENWGFVKGSYKTLARDVMREFDETLVRSPDSKDKFSHTIFPVLKCAFPKDTTDWPELFYDYGKSIALWLQTVDNNELDISTYKQIRKMLKSNLQDLPGWLKDMRKNSKDSPRHIGNHLVLLWDDPDQLPNYDKQASI
jgi:CHAT domain-containing protein